MKAFLLGLVVVCTLLSGVCSATGVHVNGTTYLTSPSVNIESAVSDGLGVGVATMRFSIKAAGSDTWSEWTPWVDFEKSATVVFQQVLANTVYDLRGQYQDKLGNMSDAIQAADKFMHVTENSITGTISINY